MNMIYVCIVRYSVGTKAGSEEDMLPVAQQREPMWRCETARAELGRELRRSVDLLVLRDLRQKFDCPGRKPRLGRLSALRPYKSPMQNRSTMKTPRALKRPEGPGQSSQMAMMPWLCGVRPPPSGREGNCSESSVGDDASSPSSAKAAASNLLMMVSRRFLLSVSFAARMYFIVLCSQHKAMMPVLVSAGAASGGATGPAIAPSLDVVAAAAAAARFFRGRTGSVLA
jgi:hypothetical protein